MQRNKAYLVKVKVNERERERERGRKGRLLINRPYAQLFY